MGEASGSPSPPALVVVCGLPGVGKSTVAGVVSDRLEASRLRTDVVRKELFDDPAYTDAETATVYDELLVRARDRLVDGHSVVLDGTFRRRDWRAEARDLAGDFGAGFRLLRVECPEPVVERRIVERDGVSDADLEIHRQFRDRFEPVEMDHVVVDNSGSEAETRRQVDAVLRQ